MPGVRFPVSEFLCFASPTFFFFHKGSLPKSVRSSYGHTTVKAPHPIRTAKLSTVGPDQYFGRGLQGNLGCCMSFCFIFFSLLRTNIFAPDFFLLTQKKEGCQRRVVHKIEFRFTRVSKKVYSWSRGKMNWKIINWIRIWIQFLNFFNLIFPLFHKTSLVAVFCF